MKIAFLHYHLKTGGVTTVLKNQIEALHQDCRVLVLTGDPAGARLPVPVVAIPGLAYSDPARKADASEDVADAVVKAIHSFFRGPCDVLHVHNPTLAKNTSFQEILKALQNRQVCLFLQIHDFAEDGRPQVYFADEYVADCHYGVVNLRDYEILIRAGLKPDGVHRLPNALSLRNLQRGGMDGHCKNVLYPIRAIRRKNIGEAILVSLFLAMGDTLAITLPPNSPADFKSYHDWKGFVQRHNLPVEFDKGLRHDFGHLLQSCSFLITTSITEGFGFCFIEPWLSDKLVWGRKLPGVCRDFEDNGMRLEHLYPRLDVPLDWIDADAFFDTWRACILRVAQQFSFPVSETQTLEAFTAVTSEGRIDYGLLQERFQQQVVARLLASNANRAILTDLNPFLSTVGSVPGAAQLIHHNRQAVLEHYGLQQYRKRLLAIYAAVASRPITQRINKSILLSQFLDLSQFSLLKWDVYNG